MPLSTRLQRELDGLASRSLRRSLREVDGHGKHVELDGRRRLNLAGNDYLGLATHPHLKRAAADAAQRRGTGGGASRLVAGHSPLIAETERRFADFKHAEAALLLPTGYAANLAVLTALARPGDLIVQDKLNHASLLDAAKASDADVRTYAHGDLNKAERLLRRHHETAPDAERFLVTDAVFSMDGDTADLPALADLAEQHDATLVVDEAHATGVLGDTGAGLAEAQDMIGRVGVTVSTASKALGGLGGVVTASRLVIDTLVNRARPLIYSTAVPPAQAAAVAAALDVVRDEPDRRRRLAELSGRLRRRLTDAGWPGLPPEHLPTPIVPLRVGEIDAALALQAKLESAGILAVAIRPPTVPPGTARVRLSLRADLTDDELEQVIMAAGTPARATHPAATGPVAIA
ncbi:MAG: 8-amino-7-oxononanoate synthase [Planctomycetota bacterium]